MKSNIKIGFLAVAVGAASAFAISSCTSTKDKMPPVITINKPTDTTMITIPDSIHVDGVITDDGGLHEMSVLIIDSASNDTVVEQYPYVHNSKAYSLRFNYFPKSIGTFILHVTAEDHEARRAEATRTVRVE